MKFASRLICGAVVFVSVVGAEGTKTTASEMRAACYSAVAKSLQASQGKMTPEVREAYLTWAEGEVGRDLKAHNVEVSAATLKEAHSNQTLREAIFGSVYPPDASILQNYDRLKADMGEKFMSRYGSLALAIAVAKRTKGVESWTEFKNVGRDYQPEFWQDESLQIPESAEDKKFEQALADYMSQASVSASDLYQKPNLQAELINYLKGQHIPDGQIGGIKTTPWFGERLKYAMVLLHQRPGAREAKPSTVEWLNHLTSILQATPASTPTDNGKPFAWPMFPADTAPWPLLMPLAHPVPISEANYVWDAFQGKHGEDRYHTYGPYRDDDAEMPFELSPSKWHWDAWPDRIQHGGECVPISKGTVDLYSCLVKPAMWAGQPGHANLISYQSEGGYWLAEVEQAFAGGPDVTFAQWYFDEDLNSELRHRDLYYWAGAEYQLGLALAMDLGLESYEDTRIATILYKAMPEEDKATVGTSLLRSAIQTNPFNPEVWYRLAEQTGDPTAAQALVKSAIQLHDNGLFVKAGMGPRPARVNTCLQQYVDTLAQFVAHYAILDKTPPASEAKRREIYLSLKSTPGLGADDLASYASTFSGASTTDGAAADLAVDQSSASNHEPFGLLRMGERYRDGDGVARDPAKAEEMFAEAGALNEQAAGVEWANYYSFWPADWVKVSASSAAQDQTPDHLINGTGMVGILHDNNGEARSMWHTTGSNPPSKPAPELPAFRAWAKFDFGEGRFDTILIWNHNQQTLTDRGFRKVEIYATTDGKTWTALTSADGFTLPRAGGGGLMGPVKVHVPSGKNYKSIVLASNENYGGNCFGLSAVKFAIYRPDPLIPASQITVRASSEGHDQFAGHLIDGGGMLGPYHDNNQFAFDMWHTGNANLTTPANGMPASPAWARFDFKNPQKLEEIQIWNENQPGLSQRGFNKTRIYGTSDGTSWFSLTKSDLVQLPPANGSNQLEAVSVPLMSGDKKIKSVIIAADSVEGNRGGDCYGLSAVRFMPRY